MKYYPRLELYKASNVVLSIKNLKAYSYDWWLFLEQIGERIVFNDYFYSVTTRGHQRKVLQELHKHGIPDPIVIHCPAGLQSNLDSAITYYENEIADLKILIAKPRTRPEKNVKRAVQIEYLTKQIKVVKELQAERVRQYKLAQKMQRAESA